MTAALAFRRLPAADSSPVLLPRLSIVPPPSRPAEANELDVRSIADLLAGTRRWQNRIAWLYIPLIGLTSAVVLLDAPIAVQLAASFALLAMAIANVWLVPWSLTRECRDLGVSSSSLRTALRAVQRAHGKTRLSGLTGTSRDRALAELILADMA